MMKRSQSARPRTRLSRSLSATSPRKEGWKISLSMIAGGTLLLVSVFFLQARLGGFGSHRPALEEDVDDDVTGLEGQHWDGTSTDELHRLKLFEKDQEDKEANGAIGVSRGPPDMTDLEEENAEFENIERPEEKLEDFDEDDMDMDDVPMEDLENLKEEAKLGEKEEEDEDEETDETDESENQQDGVSNVKLQEHDDLAGRHESDMAILSDDERKNGTKKRLERLGQIKTLPRWSPSQDIGDANSKAAVTKKETERYIWDRVLGIMKMPLKTNMFNSTPLARKFGMGKGSSRDVKVDDFHVNTANTQTGNASFSTDDEPMDGNVEKRLNEVVDVEDALLLKRDKPLKTKVAGTTTSPKSMAPKKVFDTEFARKAVRAPIDPWNPTGNSLLEDPDTVGPGGLTKNDRAILKALRKASDDVSFTSQSESTEGKRAMPVLEQPVKSSKGRKELLLWDGDSKSEIENEQKLGTATKDSRMRDGVQDKVVSKHEHVKQLPRKRVKGDTRRWGYFPGLNSMLSFSEFMEQFLGEECQLNVFMAWNSPPWSYTVRHQRGLESLLHFHPKACVTVFSETIELDFFKKFVQKGYRVAVVRPNLEEFLEGTPAEIFASVWLTWRKVDLFYIHYSELLRLSALYKYGGIYLDSDVIVLKPLDALSNTAGLEVLADGKTRLNGAVMAFQKASPFIRECMEEYTATYDDKRLEWNGADLIARVADRPIQQDGGKTWKESEQELRILPPFSFFPLSASNITSYFGEPMGEAHEAVLREIMGTAYTLHLWNGVTSALVPETSSLVGRVLESRCIWCSDVI